MIIRRAAQDDIINIMNLCREYHGETMMRNRKVNEERFFSTIYHSVLDDGWTTLIALDNDKVIGVLIAFENYSFFEDAEMDIDFFYIKKEYRGTQCARELVWNIKKLAISRNVGIIYCGCHSNMADGGKNNSLFMNLFKKFGFEETGTNLHLSLGV